MRLVSFRRCIRSYLYPNVKTNDYICVMPIDYKKYHPNWKTEIRPAVLTRANNRCECCGVDNYEYVFRGYLQNGKEVYQDVEGRVFDAENSRLLFKDLFVYIKPLSGNPNQKAIKVVLTIAHLNHNVDDNEMINLKAMCQRCHLRYDKEHHKATRKTKRGIIELQF